MHSLNLIEKERVRIVLKETLSLQKSIQKIKKENAKKFKKMENQQRELLQETYSLEQEIQKLKKEIKNLRREKESILQEKKTLTKFKDAYSKETEKVEILEEQVVVHLMINKKLKKSISNIKKDNKRRIKELLLQNQDLREQRNNLLERLEEKTNFSFADKNIKGFSVNDVLNEFNEKKKKVLIPFLEKTYKLIDTIEASHFICSVLFRCEKEIQNFTSRTRILMANCILVAHNCDTSNTNFKKQICQSLGKDESYSNFIGHFREQFSNLLIDKEMKEKIRPKLIEEFSIKTNEQIPKAFLKNLLDDILLITWKMQIKNLYFYRNNMKLIGQKYDESKHELIKLSAFQGNYDSNQTIAALFCPSIKFKKHVLTKPQVVLCIKDEFARKSTEELSSSFMNLPIEEMEFEYEGE